MGGFPGMEAIRTLFNSWKAPYTFNIHKSGWLVIRFQDEKTRQDILESGPHLIFGRPLVMKYMPSLFDFGSASFSILPVWVPLPGLPCDI